MRKALTKKLLIWNWARRNFLSYAIAPYNAKVICQNTKQKIILYKNYHILFLNIIHCIYLMVEMTTIIRTNKTKLHLDEVTGKKQS